MQLISSGIPKADAYGGVIISSDGKILLRKPYDHSDGYAWTYAKGRIDDDETPEQRALFEADEEIGLRCRIVSAIPELFSATTTSSAYFLMLTDGGSGDLGWVTEATCWATEDQARDLIAQSPFVTGRLQDLDILDAALSVWRSGHVENKTAQDFTVLTRMFEMVSVLHCRGYEKLRVFPYKQLGEYRVGVLPSKHFSIHNGAWVSTDISLTALVHSSKMGNRAFGWLDALDDSPEQLADKYILRFPKEAQDGFGSDPNYAAWFHRLLAHTRQGGLPVMLTEGFDFGPYDAPAMPIVHHAPKYKLHMGFPLPPPGEINDDLGSLSWTSPSEIFVARDLAATPKDLGSPVVISAIVCEIIEHSRADFYGETTKEPINLFIGNLCDNITCGYGYKKIQDWHNCDGLGSALVKYFNIRPEELFTRRMRMYWFLALWAIVYKTKELLTAFKADPIAKWEEQFQPQITALHDWAVSVFIGTNVVFDPDRVIGDFVWIQDFRGPANQ